MVPKTDDDRTLTAAGLARLLARLDPDADKAALEYERLRRTLVRFFDWRDIGPSDECADETFDRLARRLDGGTTVEDVPTYLYGIARMVLLERRRRPPLDPLDERDDRVAVAATPPDEDRERVSLCLDRCLAELPPDSQSLVLRYYEGERHSKIDNRRRLAATLGLSDNALRSRVQRLRDRLELCIQQCTAADRATG
jgi:DNA-directed RNA polymerase specialized sigma24 family protein